jgi:hypothetical protein
MTKLVNRAKMTTATTGTGTLTLGSAVDGYQTFADAGVVDTDVVRYVIEDGDAWEIGTGTYTSSGTTLSRSVSESSNADAALNLTGAAVVFVSAVAADVVTPTGTQTLTNKTLDAVILNDGYTEEVFAVTGTTPALSPTNGSIQTWTLSGASTPTAGTWASGQSITLLVDDGTANTITWTTLAVVWKTDGGSAPTLNTSGDTVIALWKVGTTIYGARVGDA